MEIIHKNITEQLLYYFIENIRSGNWRLGEKIPSENQLTAELKVSRASIRQVISQLAGVGVLETIHGKGTYLVDDQVDDAMSNKSKITAQDCKDVEKVLEFRRIVESEACYIATEKKSQELLNDLSKCVQEMQRSREAVEKFVSADIRFHQEICKATENPLLEKSMIRVFEENRRSQQLTYNTFGYHEGIHYHKRILQAMKEGDSTEARQAMYEHLQNGIERLKRNNSN